MRRVWGVGPRGPLMPQLLCTGQHNPWLALGPHANYQQQRHLWMRTYGRHQLGPGLAENYAAQCRATCKHGVQGVL